MGGPMPIKPKLLSVQTIHRVGDGVFHGLSQPVAAASLAIALALIGWIVLAPDNATRGLAAGRDLTLAAFRAWYVYALAGFVAFCLMLICLPVSGRLRLGGDGAEPEYSTFSWLSMMFCAGIGAGILIYAVGEPLAHFERNPDIILNHVSSGTGDAAASALSYTYLHWGLSAWSCYAVLALAIALYSHRYGMPLTIRTALAPLLGRRYGQGVGTLIDVFSIVAVITGVATTLAYGVAQFVAGAADVSGATALLDEDREPGIAWQLAALALSAVIATGSVVSGVGRGIKWLSNGSIALFFIILAAFAVLTDGASALARYGQALGGYITDFPVAATRVARADTDLATWQTDWTIFYWAWWIAFAPFVALFLARVSRGRTVRAFVIGCMLTPVVVCTVWFAFVGGAALDLQLAGNGASTLAEYPLSAQIYETFRGVAPAWLTGFGNTAIALLMLMLLITTLNAAILAINTIAAAGDATHTSGLHISTWGLIVTGLIGALVLAGGTTAIRDAMIIGALPFSFVIALSMVSTGLSLIYESAAPGSGRKVRRSSAQ